MIENVLRDGTVKEDLTGHIVKYEDAKTLYKWISERMMKDAYKRRKAGPPRGHEQED
jgi:hypothetical protein